MAYRVIQWTTGNVGRRSLRAVIENPLYELVGVYSHGTSKVGRDAAELCGLDTPTGVLATNDVEALFALKPDVCVYNPMWSNVDELCRILEAGINIVATAAFITGRWMGEEERARIRAAGEKGGATLFGSGMNPGFANMMAIVSSQVCNRVDQVRVLESVDSTGYDSWETEVNVGFGKLPGTPGLVEAAAKTTEVFSDAVELTADALGVTLDEITFDIDYAVASADNELGYATIRKGEITAVDGRWRGKVGGKDLIVLRFQWLKGPNVENGFDIKHGYFIDVIGMPTVHTHVLLVPPKDWNEENYMGLGMIMTAMPAVNAIPHVVAAKPGIVMQHELPAYGAKGFARG
ncbi:dihydrodipicolinate reductase [Sphingomonas montanisoli]|uniref:Dihydrodipicolinate reductase n=1 Tax=Sphingomonas montanisoli TaxID=2606412 RepID=A0A5D9BZ31_9SPHN|nr:dihydrodipicolinate reductase [Sphingomonas montanisoli]TZG24167.1 dihydrodipicolinate reductase [Sphingomonas montanisoli]